jgi:hypothetical protein
MPAVKRIRIKGLKSRFRVTLYGKEGTYALSAPKTRLGYLLLPVARAHPLEVRLKSAVQVDIPKGVRPVGKATRRSLTYVPLRPRRNQSTKKQAKTASVPKIEEVTSAVFAPATTKKKRGRKKQATATAA